MNRKPSLHITEETLADIIAEIYNREDEETPFVMQRADAIAFARKIVIEAKTYSIASRCIIASNKKVQEKTEKIKLAGRSEAGVFAQLLLLIRRKMHHKGIQLIDPMSKDWPALKECCSMATDFCNEFGISIKEGYKEYIKIGMGMMKNFTIHKFKSVHSSICKRYEAAQEILEDKTPDQTTTLYTLYIAKINEKLGWANNDYKENPEKYVCFVRAKLQAKQFKITPEVYISAQFFAMEWGERTIIPDPFQLYGDKATERVRKYCYEKNISIKQPKKIDFKKLKNG